MLLVAVNLAQSIQLFKAVCRERASFHKRVLTPLVSRTIFRYLKEVWVDNLIAVESYIAYCKLVTFFWADAFCQNIHVLVADWTVKAYDLGCIAFTKGEILSCSCLLIK